MFRCCGEMVIYVHDYINICLFENKYKNGAIIIINDYLLYIIRITKLCPGMKYIIAVGAEERSIKLFALEITMLAN